MLRFSVQLKLRRILERSRRARYVVVDSVRAAAKEAQVERLAFVGNEHYRHS